MRYPEWVKEQLKRKTITVTASSSLSFDDMTISQLIVMSNTAAEDHGLDYGSMRIHSEYYGYEPPRPSYYLVGDREETDEEYKKRKERVLKDYEKELKKKKSKEAVERKEYERLRKKFGQ